MRRLRQHCAFVLTTLLTSTIFVSITGSSEAHRHALNTQLTSVVCRQWASNTIAHVVTVWCLFASHRPVASHPYLITPAAVSRFTHLHSVKTYHISAAQRGPSVFTDVGQFLLASYATLHTEVLFIYMNSAYSEKTHRNTKTFMMKRNIRWTTTSSKKNIKNHIEFLKTQMNTVRNIQY